MQCIRDNSALEVGPSLDGTQPLRKINKRAFLRTSVLFLASGLFGSFKSAIAASPAEEFAEKLALLQEDPDLANSMRTRNELAAALERGLERAPIRTAKSKTSISLSASNLIVACEVTGRTIYEMRYQSPVWPRGKSGITIGIGYDVGYVTPNDLAADWGSYLHENEIAILRQACGITGTGAGTMLAQLPPPHVKINWDDAMKQFSEELQPRYIQATEDALSHINLLSADSLGALVSLVYNRGASFQLPGDRYREMRNIRSHMASKNFEKVPGEIRSMKRLWAGKADMRGLLIRRDAEAALFKLGLKV